MNFVTYPTTGGMNRAVNDLDSANGFASMRNLRQTDGELGRIEQTPYFASSTQFAQATYWDAGVGSATEPTTSAVRGLHYVDVTQLAVTDIAVWLGGLQLKCFDMIPDLGNVGTNLNSACMVTPETSVGVSTINLGAALDIEIDGATTFQWRINGGAWTTLVAITTAGVSINGGTHKVWFLTATGFTVGDLWSFTRYDSIAETPAASASLTHTRQIPFATYGNTVVFCAPGGRLYRVSTETTNGTNYVSSLGFCPIYGRDVVFFANSLFVVGALTGTSRGFITSYTTIDAINQMLGGWAKSDRGNLDNFYQTDTNEADSAVISLNAYTFSVFVTLGWFVSRTQLFLICKHAIFSTSYLGLPQVVNFEPLTEQNAYSPTITTTPPRVIMRADKHVYIFDLSGVWKFDGASLTNVSAGVRDLLGASNYPIGYAYVPEKQTLYFLTSGSSAIGSLDMFVYQEAYDAWHTRGASFASAAVSLAADNSGALYIGAVSRNVFVEDTAFSSSAPLKDQSTGGSYTTPLIHTQIQRYGRASLLKELSNVYLAAYRVAAAGSGYELPYVTVSSGAGAAGLRPPASFTTFGTWTDNTDGTTNGNPVPFRTLMLVLQWSNDTGSKAPGLLYLYGLELLIYNAALRKIER